LLSSASVGEGGGGGGDCGEGDCGEADCVRVACGDGDSGAELADVVEEGLGAIGVSAKTDAPGSDIAVGNDTDAAKMAIAALKRDRVSRIDRRSI
jgi:hypothetical protein